jgi:hypothetical protein
MGKARLDYNLVQLFDLKYRPNERDRVLVGVPGTMVDGGRERRLVDSFCQQGHQPELAGAPVISTKTLTKTFTPQQSFAPALRLKLSACVL